MIGEFHRLSFLESEPVDLAISQHNGKTYAFWTEYESEESRTSGKLLYSSSRNLTQWIPVQCISDGVPANAIGNGIFVHSLQDRKGLEVVLTQRMAGKADSRERYLYAVQEPGGRWSKRVGGIRNPQGNIPGNLKTLRKSSGFSCGRYEAIFDEKVGSYMLVDHRQFRHHFLGLPEGSILALLPHGRSGVRIACRPWDEGRMEDEGSMFVEDCGPGILEISFDLLARDTDKDGLSDMQEMYVGTDYDYKDTDGDRIDDALDADPLVPDDEPLSQEDSLYYAFVRDYCGDDFYDPRVTLNVVRSDEYMQLFPNHACKIVWGELYGMKALELVRAQTLQDGVALVEYIDHRHGQGESFQVEMVREAGSWAMAGKVLGNMAMVDTGF